MNNAEKIHDNFVKRMMTNHVIAIDFFERFIPEKILKAIDLSTLKIENTTFVDKRLKHKESDILFSAKMNQSEKTGYFYVLIEHQSTPDPKMAMRLWFYIMQFYERYIFNKDNEFTKLPLLYSKVLYNGKTHWNHPLDVASFFEPLEGMTPEEHQAFVSKMLLGEFDLIDVSKMVESDFDKERWSNLMLASLHRTEKTLELKRKAQILNRFFHLLGVKNNSELARSVLEYNLYDADCELQLYFTIFKESFSAPYQEVIMNVAEALKQEGRQEGIEQGIQQGAYNSAYSIARKMVLRGTSIKEAAEVAELAPEQIEQLIKEIQH